METNPFSKVSERILDAKKIVFVTGAGISQESGIPTFRGNDGLWRKYDVMQLATISAFYENPKLVWEWYEDRRKNILAAKPNPGHFAIANLEKHSEVVIATQNIDGLHQKAGSTSVLELHGSIVRIKCTKCSFEQDMIEAFDEVPPYCKCKNILRPDVVWFGEPLPHKTLEQAIIDSSTCDVMIIAGTSLVVSPANTLPLYAKKNNAILIEVNPENTIMSSYMDISIRTSSADALPRLVELFEKN
jgi:NAD-dependent deacetylase